MQCNPTQAKSSYNSKQAWLLIFTSLNLLLVNKHNFLVRFANRTQNCVIHIYCDLIIWKVSAFVLCLLENYPHLWWAYVKMIRNSCCFESPALMSHYIYCLIYIYKCQYYIYCQIYIYKCQYYIYCQIHIYKCHLPGLHYWLPWLLFYIKRPELMK